MSKNRINEFIDDLEEVDIDGLAPSRKQTVRKRESKRHETDVQLFIRAQENSQKFKFTYKAARFEDAWLTDSLIEMAEHEWISDVLRKIKAGKEASVYLCKAGPGVDASLVAAKIYRPRSLRNLKNDGIYRTGRIDLGEDGKTLYREADVNAIIKRTKYGEELRHQSWIAYEYQTLEILHAVGADIPKPYTMERNAILMGYVGDIESAAPTLNTVSVDRNEALQLLERIIHNIDLLLTNGRIHGDLSAYNILYWDGKITLIDFPQVVPPEANPSAWNIFLRDVTRICQYFHAQGVKTNAHKLASELWTSHGHTIVKEADPRYLDPDDIADRKLWEKQSDARQTT